jgi:hypothetical protein
VDWDEKPSAHRPVGLGMRIFYQKMMNMPDQQIIDQLNGMPENLKKEVLDYMGYLLSKYTTIAERKTPRFGSARGKYTLSDDFDAPLDDFKEYME